jgi:hypothetical protein
MELEMTVELHAPSMLVVLISLLLALIALLGVFIVIPIITPVAVWLALIAYAILAFGTMIKAG